MSGLFKKNLFRGIMKERRNGVDIIIPVYNALDKLELCIESIKKHTDLFLDRVIIVDDTSPDPAVFPYLQSIEQEGIEIVRNEHNLGFSGTINKGIKYSDRDVILLNSDTIVTRNWVNKLYACAYSNSTIGTVTPFSNNATLCSIPNFCLDNTIPYGLSIDEYADVIERCSMREYPRITVAVGFCMFIKRQVLNDAGLFDQETFQRGYGEENDFCWRAEQFGYYHVLCDDTYIYHSGSASFPSKEKLKLIESHERIIQNRYPQLHQENAEYVRDNPHQYLRDNVNIYAQLKNGKKNILYFIHCDFSSDALNNVGGTQFHVKDLKDYFQEDYNVFVMARDGRMLRLTAYLGDTQLVFKFPIGKEPYYQVFYNEQIQNIIYQVLTAFEINMVHVHHVQNISFDIFHVAHKLNIPLVLTMHDYFFLCPAVELLECGETFCGGMGKDCTACLRKQKGYTEHKDFLPVWREECRRALDLCVKLIVPSESVKTIYSRIYPQFASKIQVIPHGMDDFASCSESFRESSDGFSYVIEEAFQDGYTVNGWAFEEGKNSNDLEVFLLLEDREGKRSVYRGLSVNRADVARSKTNTLYLNSGFQVVVPDCWFCKGNLRGQLILRSPKEEFCSKIFILKGYVKREKSKKRIAFLGGIRKSKGSRLAYEMIKKSGGRYDWYFIGGIGDPNLNTLLSSNVYKTGWYKREDVGLILQQNQIDLVCILPIVPETFCYTASEAHLAGIPVLATDVGALSERLRQNEIGWLIPVDATAQEALDVMHRIFTDDAEYRRIMRIIENTNHRSIAQMCQEYRSIYKPLLEHRNQPQPFDSRLIYSGYVMGQGTRFYNDVDTDLLRRVVDLEARLQVINNSLEYRLARFLNREKLPFKRQIKWLLKIAYQFYLKLKGRK